LSTSETTEDIRTIGDCSVAGDTGSNSLKMTIETDICVSKAVICQDSNTSTKYAISLASWTLINEEVLE